MDVYLNCVKAAFNVKGHKHDVFSIQHEYEVVKLHELYIEMCKKRALL